MKILVIQTAFLGDVILATPVISELKRIYPNGQIDVLVRKGNESLLANNPAISNVFVFSKKEGKIKSLRLLISQIRNEKYDEVINLQRFASSGILTAFSGAKSKVGFSKNPFSFFYTTKIPHILNKNLHEVERNLMCIQNHGAEPFVRPSLFPSSLDFSFVETYTDEPYYCIAPASVWFTKQMPISKWIELSEILIQKGKVYILGGPADFALGEKIREKLTEKTKLINLSGKLSFLQSAALMRDAKRNYVNDSGPMHIASAMNAAVTAFYCSTIPGFGFGPVSTDSETLETTAKLSCRPCGLHGYKSCPKGHFKCGDIPLEHVRR